jgi:hypothetical protein
VPDRGPVSLGCAGRAYHPDEIVSGCHLHRSPGNIDPFVCGCPKLFAGGSFVSKFRLLRKKVVLAENASWLFRVTPYVIFAATWVAAALVPTFATGLMFSWVPISSQSLPCSAVRASFSHSWEWTPGQALAESDQAGK